MGFFDELESTTRWGLFGVCGVLFACVVVGLCGFGVWKIIDLITGVC